MVGWGQNDPGLIVSREKAKSYGRKDETRLRQRRLLALIVDLDKTVLHTTTEAVGETWLKDGVDDIYDVMPASRLKKEEN